MLIWIFAALGLYLVGAYFHSILLVGRIGLSRYAGSRDDAADKTVLEGRSARAAANLAENMMVFLPLALLSYVIVDADVARAIFGAQIFVIARVIYVPLYLAAVPWVRSIVFAVSMVGLLLMALALV